MSHGPALLLCGARGIPVDGPSGASAHLRGIARALARVGALQVAAPLRSDHRGVHDPLAHPVTTCPPRRWPRHLREQGAVWDARRLVARVPEIPAWIWERHTLTDAGMRLAARHGIPRLVELNAPLVRERRRFDPLRWPTRASALETRVLQSADRVVAVSPWLARWAVRLGCAASRVRVVPNASALRPSTRREATRQALGLHGLVLAFVGSNKPWHGLGRIPAILDALEEATCIVIGSGPTSLPQHPRLRAMPWTAPAALADLLAAADVGIAPYPPDAPPWFCPLKIADYRSQGLPVVATAIGDLAILMADGGEVVGRAAPRVWAEAIRRQAARPRVPVSRSWDDVVGESRRDWR